VPDAQAIVNVDDDRIRVTTWTFQDGDDTGQHRHEFDYLVVPITGGRFEISESGGAARDMEQRAAAPYLGRAGTEHNVTNRSGHAASFVEVEFKN
jgi:quercetin dioxygenase-like cupin family protein